jgi:hypothetical protein
MNILEATAMYLCNALSLLVPCVMMLSFPFVLAIGWPLYADGAPLAAWGSLVLSIAGCVILNIRLLGGFHWR